MKTIITTLVCIFLSTPLTNCHAQDPSVQILPSACDNAPCNYYKLELDAKGRLWVSDQSGLYCWEDEQWRLVSQQTIRLLRTVGDSAYVIVWRPVEPSAVYKTDGGELELVCLLPRKLLKGSGTTKFEIDNDGRVYVAGRRLISVYNPPSADEAAKRVQELVPGLVDDRIEVQTASRNAILKLGHQAEPELRRDIESSFPQLKEAKQKLLENLNDPEQVYANGPWTSQTGVGYFNIWVAEAHGSFYLSTEEKTLRFADGEYKGEVSYPHTEGMHALPRILPLAPELIIAYSSRWVDPVIIDFQKKTVLHEIPSSLTESEDVPVDLLRDENRLKTWFSECVQQIGNNQRMTMEFLWNHWGAAELEAAASMRTRLDREYGYGSMATASSDILFINPDGSISFIRSGELSVFDIGHKMRPGALRRALVDSNGVYWIMSKDQITRYWPGGPEDSPIPSLEVEDRK
jgi:hypothetical protein